VPILSVDDMFAEKLLANADRGQDPVVAYRDAIDLGMLVLAHGKIPDSAVAKAETAYGVDVGSKVRWVTDRLAAKKELVRSADALQMDHRLAGRAIDALRRERLRLWPDMRDARD
jgi:nucleotidyltransferase AbiEii toxin of type IV toxin-antitoxin system